MYYAISIIQLDYLMFGEVIMVKTYIVDPDKFLEATAMIPCILFIIGMNYKEYLLTDRKKDVYKVMQDLRNLFPESREAQRKYKVHEFCSVMQKVEFVFICCCISFTTVFSSMPFVVGMYKSWYLGEDYQRVLPYVVWYPFDYTKNLPLYLFLYLFQYQGAYTASVLFVGADLLMCGAISQNCMHLHYIANMIKEYKPKGGIKDIIFIGDIARYHGKVLNLSELVNETYSVCILLSFVIASTSICFIGFNLTSSPLQDALKFGLFMTAEIVQIAAICFYGNTILEKSFELGDAIYEHDWHEADLEYKKMLIQIITRSQKPASIRAPTFPPTSYETFMKVMTTSYKFLTVIRQYFN
uniref:Odorant receptor n=1 Tax=Megaselia scalaris TaxID=36166 RepID=T1GPT4_MEGSC